MNKTGINVLSCFDGMSAGQIALKRAGIKVNKYYASEIDKYAIQITQKNYPDTIQLGSIENWQKWNLNDIDLIIGGSPCQGFSYAGKGLNFNDPRSKLFFTFCDILKAYKPKWFMLENVKMKKEWETIISCKVGEAMGQSYGQLDMFGEFIQPMPINSARVSAQNRERLYWFNWECKQPEDKGILLGDILENRWSDKEKSYCIDANYAKGGVKNYLEKSRRQMILTKKSYSLLASYQNQNPKNKIVIDRYENKNIHQLTIDEDDNYRKLTPIECERLQTVDDNYTEGVSNSQRYKMLGNGWTVDVIAHIFKSIPISKEQ